VAFDQPYLKPILVPEIVVDCDPLSRAEGAGVEAELIDVDGAVSEGAAVVVAC
jgi:hypothetical protein